MRRVSIGTLAVFLSAGTIWYLYPQSQPRADVPTRPALSYLIAFGIGATAGATWDGTVSVSGGTILGLSGWRFSGTDAIQGTTGWKLATRPAPAVGGTGPVEENGVILTAADDGGNPSFTVTTAAGSFTFAADSVKFGAPQRFLGGRALVTQIPASLPIANTSEDEDFPAMAQSGDDTYVAYIRFVHGDRSQAVGLGTSTPITDFTPYSRPTGGDQLFLMHHSTSQQMWNAAIPITDPGQSLFRTAIAIDGQQRVWIFYAAQRDENFDLYARIYTADGTLSPEMRITTDPGIDIGPVAATDANGRVWVAWQGFRNGNLEILAAAQNGDSMSAEAIVSTSPASDWDPAIATAPNGEVAISWDTYDKGDYDVYLRRARFTDQVGLDDPIAIAGSLNFEARSSLAYDPQNRLWVAFESSGPKWGKDFGALDTSGVGIYQNHTIQIRVVMGNDVYATTTPLASVMPGVPASQLFVASNAAIPQQPNPSLAQNRAPNASVGVTGQRNSFPRLAVDSEGAVYLAYRHPAGSGLSTGNATGLSVGSIWIEELVWFDGAKWNGPGYFGSSDGLLDNRPAIAAVGPGRLVIAQAADHRLTPHPKGTPQVDGVDSDIFAMEVPISRTVETPQLTRIGTVVPAAPDPAAVAEKASSVLSDSYRVRVGGQTMQLLRGDFHRHTEISFDGSGDGPLVDAYRYGIDAAALGWMGCCDHDDGGAREYSWWLEQKYNDAYYLASKYVPMYYFERSIAYPEGHRNIMFAQRGIRPLPHLPTTAPDSAFAPAPDTTMLYQFLHFYKGVTAPHTGATDQGTDWRNNDPQVEPMVEIYQGDRQSYEMPGAPRSNTPSDSISGYEAKGYVSNALAMGYRLGFEASSDHISTHISFTNLWVTAPTRTAIIDAVSKRHVYGSTDLILADFRSGTHFMGDAFNNTGPPSFSVKLWGTNAFANVSVIKDGNIVYSTSGDRVIAFTWQDAAAQKGKTSYYYVRGLQTDNQVVWVSPMWVTIQ